MSPSHDAPFSLDITPELFNCETKVFFKSLGATPESVCESFAYILAYFSPDPGASADDNFECIENTYRNINNNINRIMQKLNKCRKAGKLRKLSEAERELIYCEQIEKLPMLRHFLNHVSALQKQEIISSCCPEAYRSPETAAKLKVFAGKSKSLLRLLSRLSYRVKALAGSEAGLAVCL